MHEAFAKLLRILNKKCSTEQLEVVRHAYRFANEAHQGQTRASGVPYIMHGLEVATILAENDQDYITCAAGLLHDVVEDTHHPVERIRQEFGEEIAGLVEGMTKISSLSFSEGMLSREEQQAQNIRKMLIATIKDLRVLFLKLADRLHNMRTLEYLKPEAQQRIAQETLTIYAPLANRMGVSEWKWELEDRSFRYLMPGSYREISRQVNMRREERKKYIQETIETLEPHLLAKGITARMTGRPKHLYSIYQKMTSQAKEFSEVHDMHGIRIITRTVTECYTALGVVHEMWQPDPALPFKDYIARPKINMYQSLHTTVLREMGRKMEVQIRTEEMDRIAREGIAAHWQYKEGARNPDDSLTARLTWLRKMYDWLQDDEGSDNLMESMVHDLATPYIYVVTPRGEVKELPEGATPLDFAYMIHSQIGHHCTGARVNNKFVPIRYNLQTGDCVEILTSKNQEPHISWLDVVTTGRARSRIRQRLREIGALPPAEDKHSEPRSRRPHFTPHVTPQPLIREVDEATRRQMLRVDGKSGIQVQFAKCCDPMPGHEIIGYVTLASGISIHRTDCGNIARPSRDTSRLIQVSWESEAPVIAQMRLVTRSRPNLLADITNALRPLNIEILNAHFGPGSQENNHFDFQYEAREKAVMDQVAYAVGQVPGVFRVMHMGVRQKEKRNRAPRSEKKPVSREEKKEVPRRHHPRKKMTRHGEA
ncbi:MAG TPA: bifunctional (p)ppGpp synthetase/guanosine-3',5'-bis(diphosphate) 3'-pyrophosphohydrolase [Candidatus Hydrogenedentes bacterium]|jgi:GTP pyrophosphokinase|nr:MAG: Bifunctional (p)ppGpp synthase/hydrolase SpoT [Candidatus Hydrogenedentes bacterium ADurb.Bin170]HNZ49667.1 bifunctional (p)ppGpp synthetase/guanosine-3',5'-bis(diphosphate) 3'-pyrophosphohydrolase [Candidatus Hydrogenedentota bacterium]HPK24297.1 bifunctional (p)ppGpp synthetase/guanosine-3',5'-bis(diphosphate) 3'-pyrophosphohydrolase [Candidatus Hydrogenedentota bacterium]HQB03952.1 bifunctional (p)ppGpp synthetase/guanosine-3',5'-bis(diphosphate) 3'-pyrophosphohydrolase [Candidatus Hy